MRQGEGEGGQQAFVQSIAFAGAVSDVAVIAAIVVEAEKRGDAVDRGEPGEGRRLPSYSARIVEY